MCHVLLFLHTATQHLRWQQGALANLPVATKNGLQGSHMPTAALVPSLHALLAACCSRSYSVLHLPAAAAPVYHLQA